MYSLVLLTALTTGSAGPSSGGNFDSCAVASYAPYACYAPPGCYAPYACYANYAPQGCFPSGASFPHNGEDDLAELRRFGQILRNAGDPDFGWDNGPRLRQVLQNAGDPNFDWTRPQH
jgi:hypothetical protein